MTAINAVGRGVDARIDVRFRVDTVWKGVVHADQVVAAAEAKRDGVPII